MEHVVFFLFAWFTICITVKRGRLDILMIIIYSIYALPISIGLYIMIEERMPDMHIPGSGMDMSSGPYWISFFIGAFFIYFPIKDLYFDE